LTTVESSQNLVLADFARVLADFARVLADFARVLADFARVLGFLVAAAVLW